LGKANNSLELTGMKFGKLTVVKRVENHVYPSGKQKSQWLCKCDCGNEIVVIGTSLTKKNGTQSCGCLSREMSSKIGRLNKKYNTYDLTGEYGIGYTSNGEEFWFDLDDYDKIKDFCWYINNEGYVKTRHSGMSKIVSIHRVITGLYDSTYDIDHKNGERSRHDNRKSNLRIATRSQNQMNKCKQKNNTSGTVGVGWHKLSNKWSAYIAVNKKQIHLGLFDRKEDAIAARKIAEDKYFCEWSYNNSKNYNIK
jgi:hypothetical protein